MKGVKKKLRLGMAVQKITAVKGMINSNVERCLDKLIKKATD